MSSPERVPPDDRAQPSDAPRGPGRRGGPLLPFLAAFAPFALLVGRFDFLVDDAFISWRYAKNLVRGWGLVFNRGESPPVEGFTNFLWVLWMALVEALEVDPIVGSRVASVACGTVLLWLVTRFLARRVTSTGLRTALGALFLATLPPFAVWSTGGLETMAFALAVFGTYDALLRPERPGWVGAGAWGLAAVLLRADGFVWVGMVLAAALVAAQLGGRPELRRAALATAAAIGLGFGVFLLWRHSYFGDWMPNTLRAKVHLNAVSLERGALYVASLGLAFVSIPIVLALAARSLAVPSGPALPAAVVVLAACAYLVTVGGDWMMFFRLLVPALPFVALLFGAALEDLAARGRGEPLQIGLSAGLFLLSLLPGWDLHPVPYSVRSWAHFRWSEPELRSEYDHWAKGVVDIDKWMLQGRALALFGRPGESVLLGNIGAIGYYSDLIVYDTLGLTNRVPYPPDSQVERATPGHDRIIPMSSFEHLAPTYVRINIADASDPWAGTPKAWRDPESEWGRRWEIRMEPLDPAQGFPENSVLQLQRRRDAP